VQSAFGVAQLDDDLPRIWSRNVLFANENLESADAGALAIEAERIFGPRGLAHRKVELVDDEAGTRLEAGFRELGWTVQCDVVMAARRAPDRETETSQVDEVSFEDLVPAWSEGWRTEPEVEDEEVVQQLAENRRVIMSAVDTRFFAARVDGTVASYCELYSDGSTGQIENVFTFERFRKRGLARAIVSRALDESRAAGHDLTFLLADRDDWPKELYRKLGFDEIGRMWEFLRPPKK
jgi:GNAT superfamily N-acetyltransferase